MGSTWGRPDDIKTFGHDTCSEAARKWLTLAEREWMKKNSLKERTGALGGVALSQGLRPSCSGLLLGAFQSVLAVLPIILTHPPLRGDASPHRRDGCDSPLEMTRAQSSRQQRARL